MVKIVAHYVEQLDFIRWWFVYLLPLSIITGLLIDFTSTRILMRNTVAICGILVTVLQVVCLTNYSYYREMSVYDPTPILAADDRLRRTHNVPIISSVRVRYAAPEDRDRMQDSFVGGETE